MKATKIILNGPQLGLRGIALAHKRQRERLDHDIAAERAVGRDVPVELQLQRLLLGAGPVVQRQVLALAGQPAQQLLHTLHCAHLREKEIIVENIYQHVNDAFS